MSSRSKYFKILLLAKQMKEINLSFTFDFLLNLNNFISDAMFAKREEPMRSQLHVTS